MTVSFEDARCSRYMVSLLLTWPCTYLLMNFSGTINASSYCVTISAHKSLAIILREAGHFNVL